MGVSQGALIDESFKRLMGRSFGFEESLTERKSVIEERELGRVTCKVLVGVLEEFNRGCVNFASRVFGDWLIPQTTIYTTACIPCIYNY